MNQRWLKFLLLMFCLLGFVYGSGNLWAKEDQKALCAVYITGIGCGNCAMTDPVLFMKATAALPELMIFEYEIYRQQKENQDVQVQYFQNYAAGQRPGVPFFILQKDKMAIGRVQVQKLAEELNTVGANAFPARDGTSVNFMDLDLTQLPGAPKIWTKNRVLIHEGGNGRNEELKQVLLAEHISKVLSKITYQKIDPSPVSVSHGQIDFEHAVRIDGWRLQWNGDAPSFTAFSNVSERSILFLLVSLLVLFIAFSFFKVKVRKIKKGSPVTFELRGRMRDFLISMVSLAALLVFFMSAKNVSPEFLENIGYDMPLPVFTFLIGLVDGFNPCNMFVLTCLLTLMISTSDSRRRLYIVASSFVGMVYIFYFLFMALWLNIFKYISFVTPLRIGIGLTAVVAGLINCKELFFFKKGISLTIQEKHKGPLMQRIQSMKDVIQKGSLSVLIASSLGLAALSSLIELPCTAGFPIIYVGILSGRGLGNTWSYYAYLVYYNAVYVLPLCVIIFIFIYTLRSRQITQRQMEVIKFIGGVIMLILGILLLVNPGLLGLKIG
jgi:cytochrome c biogenesis protein CcdA